MCIFSAQASRVRRTRREKGSSQVCARRKSMGFEITARITTAITFDETCIKHIMPDIRKQESRELGRHNVLRFYVISHSYRSVRRIVISIFDRRHPRHVCLLATRSQLKSVFRGDCSLARSRTCRRQSPRAISEKGTLALRRRMVKEKRKKRNGRERRERHGWANLVMPR